MLGYLGREQLFNCKGEIIMKKTKFLQLLRDTLESEDIELIEDTNLTDLDEYDSLAILNLIAFVDKHFQMQLSKNQLRSISTVKSLMDIIGLERFS